MTETERQDLLDREHLRLLVLGYQISGWIMAAFAFVPLIYLGLGVLMLVARDHPGARTSPHADFVGTMMVVLGTLLFLFMVVLAWLKLATARYLSRRTNRGFCMAVAGISCIGVPWGTVLGVLTFVTLGRPSVRTVFSNVGGPSDSVAHSGVA